jgi:hypothetical protein
MAALAGGQVWVTSSSDEKIQKCKSSVGIVGGFNYKSKVLFFLYHDCIILYYYAISHDLRRRNG